MRRWMTPNQWARAIQLTESDGWRDAIGDDGRAITSYQVHPDWLWQWATVLSMEPFLNERWDDFVGRVVLAYATAHVHVDPVELAMRFHLGHVSTPESSDWDQNYADRFNRAAGA